MYDRSLRLNNSESSKNENGNLIDGRLNAPTVYVYNNSGKKDNATLDCIMDGVHV